MCGGANKKQYWVGPVNILNKRHYYTILLNRQPPFITAVFFIKQKNCWVHNNTITHQTLSSRATTGGVAIQFNQNRADNIYWIALFQSQLQKYTGNK